MLQFIEAMQGHDYPAIPSEAQARLKLNRTQVGIKMRRPEAAYARGTARQPFTAADSLWQSFNALAQETGQEPPKSLTVFDRPDHWDVIADPGGSAIAVLPDPERDPLDLIGPHAILRRSGQTETLVRVLDCIQDNTGVWTYTARDALIGDDHTLVFI